MVRGTTYQLGHKVILREKIHGRLCTNTLVLERF